MSEQYFKSSPTSQAFFIPDSRWCGRLTLSFQTDNGVFSKQRMGLWFQGVSGSFADSVPAGTSNSRTGSGYGPVTIAFERNYIPQAQVTGVEINERAYQLAQANSQLNRVENTAYQLADADNGKLVSTGFVGDQPTIRAGKQVIQQFILTLSSG